MPDTPVFTLMTRPVAWLVMVIVALGTTAPLGSVIVPCTLPVEIVVCDHPLLAQKTATAQTQTVNAHRKHLPTLEAGINIPHPFLSAPEIFGDWRPRLTIAWVQQFYRKDAATQAEGCSK